MDILLRFDFTNSEGPNNWEGVMQGLHNGALTNASIGTGIKAAVGSQAADAYRTLGGAALDLLSSPYNYNVSPNSTQHYYRQQ